MAEVVDPLDKELNECFRRHSALVYRRALVLMGSRVDAEDVVQEVFVRVANKLDEFRGEARVSTWLYSITTNYCLTQLRNRSRQGELLRESHSDAMTFAGAPNMVDTMSLRKLLAKASPQEAAAAIGIYVDGMTRPEVAASLGVSLRTVGNLLTRFGEWAREELETPDEQSTRKSKNIALKLERKSKNYHSDLPRLAGVGVKRARKHDIDDE